MSHGELSWGMGYTFMTGSIGVIRAVVGDISFPPSTTACLRVAAQITTEGRNGFPDNEEAAQLGEIEDDLTNGLIEGLFFAAVTAEGRRDFHLYATPESDIGVWGRRLRDSHLHHELMFFRNQDPDHKLYEILRDEGAAANADRQIIDELLRNGADLEKKHQLQHFLYFPSEDGARAAAAETAGNHLTATIAEADGGQWRLELSGPGYAGHYAVAKDRAYLDSVALKHDGDYDGWEAAVEAYEE